MIESPQCRNKCLPGVCARTWNLEKKRIYYNFWKWILSVRSTLSSARGATQPVKVRKGWLHRHLTAVLCQNLYLTCRPSANQNMPVRATNFPDTTRNRFSEPYSYLPFTGETCQLWQEGSGSRLCSCISSCQWRDQGERGPGCLDGRQVGRGVSHFEGREGKILWERYGVGSFKN